MTEIKDKTPSEILAETKKSISEAYAMKPLCSGDINIIISNQAAKNCFLNQSKIEGVKILH
jgi:hypothetical protein